MATSIRTWALGQLEKGQSPAYIYMYSHPHPYEPGAAIADLNPATAGAYHTSEVPYFLLTQEVYNRIRKTRAWSDYDRQLANAMSDVLIAFATTGTPQTTEVRFPKFTKRAEEYVEFGDRITTGRFDVARMDFFATVNMPGVVGPGAIPRSPRD
jgi:para-nitrobenzyl esterase